MISHLLTHRLDFKGRKRGESLTFGGHNHTDKLLQQYSNQPLSTFIQLMFDILYNSFAGTSRSYPVSPGISQRLDGGLAAAISSLSGSGATLSNVLLKWNVKS